MILYDCELCIDFFTRTRGRRIDIDKDSWLVLWHGSASRRTGDAALDLVDYARYNENFVLVVTSSCCIRWDSTGYQGRSPWLVRARGGHAAMTLCLHQCGYRSWHGNGISAARCINLAEKVLVLYMVEAKRGLLSGIRFDKRRGHDYAVIVVADDQARMRVRGEAANAIGTGRHSLLASNELERNLHNNALLVLSACFYDQTAQTCKG